MVESCSCRVHQVGGGEGQHSLYQTDENQEVSFCFVPEMEE